MTAPTGTIVSVRTGWNGRPIVLAILAERGDLAQVELKPEAVAS